MRNYRKYGTKIQIRALLAINTFFLQKRHIKLGGLMPNFVAISIYN